MKSICYLYGQNLYGQITNAETFRWICYLYGQILYEQTTKSSNCAICYLFICWDKIKMEQILRFVICMDKICPDKQQIDGKFVVFIRTNGNRRKTLILCLLVQITKKMIDLFICWDK